MSKHDQTLPNVKNCNVSTAISHQSFCHPNPCYNGGTCSEAISGFSCACPSDYTGPFCKGKKDMLFINYSLKKKTNFVFQLAYEQVLHLGESHVSGTRDETWKTTFCRGSRRLPNLSSVWNFVLTFVLGVTDSKHSALARSIHWFDFT